MQCRNLNDGLIEFQLWYTHESPEQENALYRCLYMQAYFDFLMSELQNVKLFEVIYIYFPLGIKKIEILYLKSMGKVI